MLKFFRTTTYLLLLSLVLNVVEWPFVDEILAEQTQAVQQTQPVASAQASTTSDGDAVRSSPATVKYSAASVYHTLMDLLDTAPSLSFAATRASNAFPTSIEQRFASRSLPAIDRPPAFSLS
ncbi:hypothetical protein ACUXQ2_005484 [Cupriavidus metallidurans]